MKLMKFGKALLISALSAGVALSITSCLQSYATGYLYVTGLITAQSSGNGIISGFVVDHNTGKLNPIHGLPISSGGANPVRAVLITGSRFLYVLNRGVNSTGGADCTSADPCQNSNITEFSVGGNGVLVAQQTFYTQGINPFRMIADSSGNYLYVLDHDAPSSAACADELGGTVTACGDITVFSVNQNTGRLSLVVNAQPSAACGCTLPYFPVPANPIDFTLASGYLLTLSGTPAAGDSVFPYTYNSGSGQLTINQNTAQPLSIGQATAIVNGTGYIYVLDNEGSDVASTGATSQILPFQVGSGGALQAQTGGVVADDTGLNNPIYLLVESKGKFLYLANQGNNTQGTNADSGYAGYVIDPSTHQLSFIAGEPFGSGSGPQCLVEDPSDQFIYSADYNDSSVTGRVVDPNSGVLNHLVVTSTFPLQGPATWCLMDGRTN
ncbi:MAG: beta-propeller fold lactonase family protein [Terracidiphilus sp.]|nr:beta-propeller fold lactonase family protein [Terracidiphilus sp.]